MSVPFFFFISMLCNGTFLISENINPKFNSITAAVGASGVFVITILFFCIF